MAQGRDSRGRYTSGEDPLDGLAASAADAAKALGDLGKAAGAAQPPLKKLGDDAAAAGGATDEAARKTAILTTALGNLAANGLERAGEALAEFIGDLPEAAARSEASARALEQLGEAYGAVQQATNGTVSAQQAAAVQQRALQSGLRLSAQELAAVTARARDFSRTTGTDLNQALEQLTDQLIDPGEELRKFGVFLQTGMSAGDALRETLRQLGAQAQTTGAAQVSLAESMEMAKRASTEASDALAGMIAQRLELRDFFVQLTSWIDDAKNSTNGWETAIDTAVGTLREMIGLRGQASGQQNQSASGAFTGEAGALMQQARGRGLNFGGLEIGSMGVDMTPEQRSRFLAIARRAALGQITQQMLAIEVQGFTAEVGVTTSVRDADAAAAAAAAARARADELRRRNRASQSTPSSSSTQAPDLAAGAFAQLRADPSGLQAFLGALSQRAVAEQQAARGGSIAQRQTGIDLQRQSAEAGLGAELSGVQRGGAPFSDRARASAEAETRQRTERTRILRDQREALAQLVVEAQREEDIARRMGRPTAEVNELVRQRIGIQTALAQSSRDLVAAQEETGSALESVGGKMIGMLEGTADAFGEAVVAALEGSKSFGESMEEMVRATLRALAKLAIVEALKEGAMAIAAVATYRYDAAVQHGIAAGMWAGVAVLSGAGVAAMGAPKSSGGAGAGAGGGTATRSADTGRSARVDEKAAGGPLNLVINVSGAAFTDAGVQQAVSASLRDAVGNGYLTRTQLAGLLGGD